ncbi:MAG TPA: peptidoglycan-binding domain-containing protein [Vicinamibacteria bacterium]|nr:peptidoglycan-binding domain-containing protein [Vicinamibacteria bacterium]
MQRPPSLAIALGIALALAAGSAAAADVTLPRGTAIEVVMDTPLDSDTATAGQTFRTRVKRSIFVEGHLAVPRDAALTGRVRMVRSTRDGARSGVLAVRFEELVVDGRSYPMDGTLTSVQADDRRKILESHGKLTTGRKVDVVLIGEGNPAVRADTLVGISGSDTDDLAEDWAKSGLGPASVKVAPGTEMAVQLNKDLVVAGVAGRTPEPGDRNFYTSEATVRALQHTLKGRGLYAGEPHGKLDDETRRAIARFQLERGDKIATGDADHDTLVALGVPRGR